MGKTRWRSERQAAYQAGVLHADGGDDTHDFHDARGCAEQYDAGYIDHRDFLLREAKLRERLADTPENVIRDLLEHAVYDRERNDECADAVERAEAWLERNAA